MIHYKKFSNGLRLIINKMDGFLTVSCGVMVGTGSANETDADNGISHFIEHTMFKGTQKRTSFEISDYIDGIGAQINAFTGKEMTCYYTKSIKEHAFDSLEVLSDIFFNSVFDEKELDKEKGVIVEEINMCEDEHEDLCLDLLSESYFGKEGLGRTILGSAKNVKSFTDKDVHAYMDKYYTADNVVISVAGDVDVTEIENYVRENFAEKFIKQNSSEQFVSKPIFPQNLLRVKKTEQTHLGFSMPAFAVTDEMSLPLAVANIIFGGGMSSRLFQKVREEMGLCYSVYSYVSQYKSSGVLEIYAGVNTEEKDSAIKAIIEETRRLKKDGITDEEFKRGKEQIKSAFIMGQESTSSQMLLYGRYLMSLNEVFDFERRINQIASTTKEDVAEAVKRSFDLEKASTATVGPKRKPIKIII